jgi:hypothetical protein
MCERRLRGGVVVLWLYEKDAISRVKMVPLECGKGVWVWYGTPEYRLLKITVRRIFVEEENDRKNKHNKRAMKRV